MLHGLLFHSRTSSVTAAANLQLENILDPIQNREAARILDVNTGEVKGANGGKILRALALGSCISCTSWDPIRRMGAMAHIMLPGAAPMGHQQQNYYAYEAIIAMLELMKPEKNNLVIHLAGAGNVLQRADDTICEENIDSVTTILQAKGLEVSGTSLGGYQRRTVWLDTATGVVSVSVGDGRKMAMDCGTADSWPLKVGWREEANLKVEG